MRVVSIAGLMLSCALTGLAVAQTPAPSRPLPPDKSHRPGPPPQAMQMPASAASVPMTENVITVKGACQGSDTSKPGCVDSVTREQFEKLTNALKPDMTLEQKRTFAENYGKLLAFYDAARSLGLENDPKVQQVFSFAQKQILLQALNEHYSDEYAHPSDQQIQSYYDQNSGRYREATLERIIIPRTPGKPDQAKMSDDELKAYAEEIRKKWAAGGDAAELQKEAFAKQGLTTASPDVKIGAKQPGSLPPQHEDVFNLKAGEVSQPFADTGAFYLYKVVSIRQIPLSEVTESISKTIHDQELKDKIQQIAQGADAVLNTAYFGEEKQPTPASGPAGAPPIGAVAAPGPSPSSGAAASNSAASSSAPASSAPASSQPH